MATPIDTEKPDTVRIYESAKEGVETLVIVVSVKDGSHKQLVANQIEVDSDGCRSYCFRAHRGITLHNEQGEQPLSFHDAMDSLSTLVLFENAESNEVILQCAIGGNGELTYSMPLSGRETACDQLDYTNRDFLCTHRKSLMSEFGGYTHFRRLDASESTA